MDAPCKIQGSIHVFRLVNNMCPGKWVHITLYGPLLDDTEWGRPAEPYGDIYHGYDTYTGYYVGEYVGYHNEGLSFVFNKYTNQVVLIRYQRDRHGNSNVLSDVKEYNLLPYLL